MKRTFLFLLCLVTSGLVTSAQEPVLITPQDAPPLSQIITPDQVSDVYRDGSREVPLLATGANQLKTEFQSDWTIALTSPLPQGEGRMHVFLTLPKPL